jgi:AraC-like DNA-binding protein
MLQESFGHNPRTLLHIAPYLLSRSVPPADIFKRVGVSPSALLNADGWVSRELCFALGSEVNAVTGDRFPGADIGRRFRLTDLGTWGVAVSGARTVREACLTAVNGIGLIHQGTDLRFDTEGASGVLSMSFAGRSAAHPQQHILGALAVLRGIALLAGAPEAVGAQFVQPYERAGDRLEETFGPSLAFGCDSDGIVIDRAILDFPLPPFDKATRKHDPLETAERLDVFVKELLPYGGVTIDRVASLLRLSRRTLQRRLRDFGFSFEELVDDVRRVEAIRRVGIGEESVLEIAFMLGYSDQAHFTRAFRRWTGLSPRDYARGF